MKIKYLLIGLISGVLLATAGTAAAQTIIEKVTASVRNDFTVELDGEKVQLKNAPLAYKGASYLPVRDVAELVGKDVDFDNGIIKIETTIETPKEDESVNTETPVEVTWITLNDASVLNSLYIEVGPDKMKIGDLEFDRPDGRTNAVVEIATSKGVLLVKVDNGLFLLNPDNLKALEII